MKGSISDMLTSRLFLAKWRYGTDNGRDGAQEPFVFREIPPHPLQGPHNNSNLTLPSSAGWLKRI